MPRVAKTSDNQDYNRRINFVRQARKDLRELELARERVNLLNQNKRPEKRPPPRKPPPPKESSTSDDDDDDWGAVPSKIPRTATGGSDSDEVLIVGELKNGTTENRETCRAESKKQRQSRFDKAAAEEAIGDMNANYAMPSSVVNFLEGEIEAEEQNSNVEGLEKPSIKGFEIKNDKAEVQLTKRFGKEHIKVHFNVNNSLYFTSDEATSSLSLPAFSVEVIKEFDRLCFNLILDETDTADVFDCRIESFYYLPIGQDEVNEVLNKNDNRAYQLSLTNCNDQFQEKFRHFLEERGITRRFCQELVHYSTHYEHQEYVCLLKKVKDFIHKF